MPSSRSTSPTPPSSKSPFRNGSEGGSGGGGTLSNDALYAPLATYGDGSSSTSISTPGKKKSSHSLSLQTSSNLRESSLITFLTSISQNLKTSHPQEHELYRGMGGSIARYGTGDNDRASSSMRGVLEGKLLNRSLVLVGGGVHGSGSAATTPGKRSSDVDAKDVGLVGLGVVASSTGKRERKRVGGNGIFGCISNKKRKRLLRESQERRSQLKDDSDLKVQDGEAGIGKNTDATSQKEQPEKSEKSSTNHSDIQEKVGSVIETIHNMWLKYIQQLLSPINEANNISSSSTSSPSMTFDVRKQIVHLLANAEHVGMPATIVECPSRLHLVDSRCVIVNETKETWNIAMLKKKKQKSRTKDESKPKEKSDTESSNQSLASLSWKIILVPKRGTMLEVDLPWLWNASSPIPQSLKKYITFRIEH